MTIMALGLGFIASLMLTIGICLVVDAVVNLWSEL